MQKKKLLRVLFHHRWYWYYHCWSIKVNCTEHFSNIQQHKVEIIKVQLPQIVFKYSILVHAPCESLSTSSKYLLLDISCWKAQSWTLSWAVLFILMKRSWIKHNVIVVSFPRSSLLLLLHRYTATHLMIKCVSVRGPEAPGRKTDSVAEPHHVTPTETHATRLKRCRCDKETQSPHWSWKPVCYQIIQGKWGHSLLGTGPASV